MEASLVVCRCVLAVIIVVNLRGALRKFADVPSMWRMNHVDTAIWLLTMATSALVNTELGLLVGVLVSAFCVLGRTQWAPAAQLGQAGHMDLYEDPATYKGLKNLPGVVVFRYGAPVYYANQALFKKALYRCVGLDPVQEKARRRKQEKRKKKQEVNTKAEPESAGTQVRDVEVSTEVFLSQGAGFHTLVIDCGPVLFLDTAGVGAMKELLKDYKELGVWVLLARCNTSVLDSLHRGGYLEHNGGDAEKVFFTIDDAVSYAHNLPCQNGDCDASRL